MCLILLFKNRVFRFFTVIDGMVHNERNSKRCLKCNSFHCTFADCNESNYFVCLEVPVFILQVYIHIYSILKINIDISTNVTAILGQR